MEENKEKQEQEMVCHVLEVKYEKSRGREISWKPSDNEDLYPQEWHSNNNYLKKAKVLAEAIEKGCLITETTEYLDMIEGVRRGKEEEEEER